MMKEKLRLKKLSLLLALALLPASTARAQASAWEQFQIRALFAEPGRPSVYEIAFTTQEALPAEAEFNFEFPAVFDLTQLQIAGSPDINGGFALQREGQKVWVKRSGLGQSVAAGTLVRIRLGAIVNPQKLASDAAVTVQMRLTAQSAWSAAAKPSVVFMRAEKRE